MRKDAEGRGRTRKDLEGCGRVRRVRKGAERCGRTRKDEEGRGRVWEGTSKVTAPVFERKNRIAPMVFCIICRF